MVDGMTRYRKKPIEVDAIQWTGDNLDAIAEFVGPRFDPPVMDEEDSGIVWIWVEKSNTRCAVIAGGWVIAEPDGVGWYPCTEEQFAATYEPVDAVSEAERLRAALDEVDRHTYGWTFGTVSTVIDRIRLTAREALSAR